MNYFKIYDDMPCLWAKHKFPQTLSKALGEDWIVEFYTIDGGKRMSLEYSSVENPDKIDTFDIAKDKVFIFWNLIWTDHQDLNRKQQEHYYDMLKLGAKFKIQTYSACASLKEMVEYNELFREKFGNNVVYKKCQSVMYDNYVLNKIANEIADYLKRKKEDFV